MSGAGSIVPHSTSIGAPRTSARSPSAEVCRIATTGHAAASSLPFDSVQSTVAPSVTELGHSRVNPPADTDTVSEAAAT